MSEVARAREDMRVAMVKLMDAYEFLVECVSEDENVERARKRVENRRLEAFTALDEAIKVIQERGER